MLKNRIHRYIYEQHWTLGIIEKPIGNLVIDSSYEIRYIKNLPNDRWFADPFILDYNEKEIRVLVEDFSYKIRRGRISRLTINRQNYNLIDYKVILDLPTHLSFPFIHRSEGKIYVIPENSEAVCWDMYEYKPALDIMVKVKTIISKPLTDAVSTSLFGESLIFSTLPPEQNGDKLYVFSKDGNLLNKISFPSKIARNAGDWFSFNGRIFRPAQNCNQRYGQSIILQEVERTSKGTFIFKNICSISSTHPLYTTGCHTLNGFKELTIIDVHGYRRIKMVRIVTMLKSILGRGV